MKSLSQHINESINEAGIDITDIITELELAGFITSIDKKSNTYTAERHTKRHADTVELKDSGVTVQLKLNGSTYSNISYTDALDKLSEVLQININESSIEIEANDPTSKDLQKLLTKHNVKMTIISDKSEKSPAVVKLSGTRDALTSVLSDEMGWDDESLADTIVENANDVFVDNAETARATIGYAQFVKIIGIATKYNRDAFKAYHRTFTSLPQLITHLKSLYITSQVDRKFFEEDLMDECGINTDTFVNN